MHIVTGTWKYPSHTAADNRQVHQIARADLSSAFVDSFVLVVDRKRPFVARRRSIESLCDCLQKKERTEQTANNENMWRGFYPAMQEHFFE